MVLTSWEREQQEHDYAQRMLAKSDQALAEVDDCYLVKVRGVEPRPMPHFRPEELSLGQTLGTGGFGIVNEVTGIFLDPDDEEDAKSPANAEQNNHNPQDTDGTGLRKRGSTPERRNSRVKQDFDMVDSNTHYDLAQAKQVMSKRVKKNGRCRYALKRLHGDLTELERARGMIDMALEAKYLSIVWHPNIIKMRGLAKGPMVDKDFFIVLDRLETTLDHRMNDWYLRNKKNRGFCGFGIRDKEEAKDLLIERMTVAYDLAAAFFYLHENRLVYRDIKPENMGFDIRGDIKVFDFGLCKSLSTKLKNLEGYGYRLTGRAGSLPYMAPEVCSMKPYDTKCDVFGFAILLWEMLSLQQAFKGMTPTQFVEKVVIGHERLPVPKVWPPLTRLMLPEAWDNDPQSRPDMKRVAILIRGDLNDMTDEDIVLHRTKHMRDRSDHSLTDFQLQMDGEHV